MADDKTLVKAVKAGDHKAFEELVRRYQRQVANLIYVRLGNREDVEDIAQEAFIKVYQSLSQYDFEGSFFSWLYKITMNLCVDEIRKRKVRKYLSLDFITEDNLEKSRKSKEHHTPSDEALREEKTEIIRGAINRLSKEYREAIILREYQDMTYNEIADTLQISLEAVKTRIFRARAELKKTLSNYFEERT